MKNSCLYFDKKYKCVFFIVHYKGLTLTIKLKCFRGKQYLFPYLSFKYSTSYIFSSLKYKLNLI